MNRKLSLILSIILSLIIPAFALADQNATPLKSYKLAYVSSKNKTKDIYITNADGTGIVRLTNNGGNNFSPIWAPNGQNLLYTLVKPISLLKNKYELWVSNLDGSDQIRLSNNLDHQTTPCWSPDGSTILFSEINGKQHSVMVSSSDGASKKSFFSFKPGPIHENRISWSPDGTKILGVFNQNGKNDIYILYTDGKSPFKITPKSGDYRFPAWSPDSKRIAFGYNNSGLFGVESGLYMLNTTGDGLTLINSGNNVSNITWAPDNTMIAYTKESNIYNQRDTKTNLTTTTVYYGTFVTEVKVKSKPTQLFDKLEQPSLPVWSPNSSSLAYTTTWVVNIFSLSGKTFQVSIPFANNFPTWSSDSKWITCEGFPAMVFAKSSIYIASVDGGSVIRLTTDPGDTNPVWSPVLYNN